MTERFNPKDLGKKFVTNHGGKITLRPDHGSKNSNGRKVERPGKKPKPDCTPVYYKIQEGVEEYFFNK